MYIQVMLIAQFIDFSPPPSLFLSLSPSLSLYRPSAQSGPLDSI